MSEPTRRTETVHDLADRVAARSGRARPDQPDGSRLTMLSGRYLLQEKIASGGMASVWRGRDQVLARTVAIKILHDHLAADPDFRERFRREAISAAKLSHPFIVGIFDHGIDGDHVFLVMEFVEGATLRDVIIDDGALPAAHAVAIGEKVARALDYAHRRGLVHRDVKPANILMGKDGAVKVADFGIAKADQIDDLTKTGMVLGTAAYVAPEQIMAQPTDGKADQYALGCVLYEALTGRQPFKAETAVATAAQRLDARVPAVRALRPEVPPGLEQVITRAMALKPEDRFSSCGHLADVLAAHSAEPTSGKTLALATRDTVGLPAHAPRRRRPPPRTSSAARIARSAALPVLGLIVFAAGLLAAVWSGAFATSPEPEPTQEAAAPAPTALEIAPEDVLPFDPPPGNGQERGSELPNLVDGTTETHWMTEGYATAQFGNLKDGVGFVIDLGGPATVDAVQLSVATEGFGVELRAADELPSTLADTEPVTQVGGAQTTTELRPPEPLETQFLIVWITEPLAEVGGENPYRAAIAEVTVLGTRDAAA
jgi:eukaryotic-like serine/threonine-protein kinase